MAQLTGVVRCVRVADEAGFTTVNEQGTTNRETFILSWDGSRRRPTLQRGRESLEANG